MTIKAVVEQALAFYAEVRAYEEVEPGFYTEMVARFGGTIRQGEQLGTRSASSI